jgi:glycosyltransferase involved in cell wall biosynthesis
VFRLAYFVSHPIQYQAPLLRLIHADPNIDLTVFFYSDFSLSAYKDKEFGRTIQWDVPLTEGYKHYFLDCWGSTQWKGWLNQPVATGIKSVLKQGEFDAVWVHGWSWLCSLQAILSAHQLKVPVLLRGEANGSSESPNLLKSVAKRTILGWLFNRISRFLPIGTLNYEFYRSYGVDPEVLKLVPYAVDNHYFSSKVNLATQKREDFRKSLSLEPGRPVILYASKLIGRKRPQDLLKAYRLLCSSDNYTNPYLLFVGDGNARASLELEASDFSENCVRFLGFQNQSALPAFYDLCDVFVLPSSFEPWGLVINEVMNAGKAVVLSDKIGCLHDLVEDGVNGRVFPVGDIKALSESLIWTLSNAEAAGKASRSKIKTWSYQEDLQGIKQALLSLPQREG